MIVNLRRSFAAIIVFTVFFGFVYALVGTGVAQLLFKHQADGSITANGSILIGQNWSVETTFDGTKGFWPTTKWFNGRPDATGAYGPIVCGSGAPKGCVPAGGGDNPLVANGVNGSSGATNLGPRSKVLLANTQQIVAWWHTQGIDPTPDLVTTSGSGLDPDISPQGASVQIPMIAKARGISASALKALVNRETNSPQLGFMGSSFVNVLQLNEALANLH